jgi:hypothetical protein
VFTAGLITALITSATAFTTWCSPKSATVEPAFVETLLADATHALSTLETATVAAGISSAASSIALQLVFAAALL